MARTKAQKKGDDLEDAVHLIETVILHSNPKIKEATITIEPKKRITVQGVRHEIDIYISIDLGSGYELVYIFECKNREESVSGNDITVFAEKIQDVNAQKGYFIAKRYAPDAINNAKRYKRIELLKASTELDILPPFITNFHVLVTTALRKDLSLRVVTSDPQDLEGHTNTDEIKVKLRNEELSYQEFAQRIYIMVKDEVMNHEPTHTFTEGTYQYDRTITFSFQPNELFVDDLECRELDAYITWEAKIIRPKIVSKFDIQTRGRVITLDFVNLSPDIVAKASFVGIKQ